MRSAALSRVRRLIDRKSMSYRTSADAHATIKLFHVGQHYTSVLIKPVACISVGQYLSVTLADAYDGVT